MDLNERRTMILNSIIELYQGTEQYDTLLELLTKNENIGQLLRSEAMVYSLIMTSNRLIWNNSSASGVYDDILARYQKGYQLYLDFAYYFLGARVLYPSLVLEFDSMLVDYSLLSHEKIDYTSFLENVDDLEIGARLA